MLGTITAASAAVPLLHATAATAAPRRTELVYVNTWKGEHVYAARFDPVRGGLTPIGPVGDANADWAVPHPYLPILYVATMAPGGVVLAFRIDAANGSLTKVGEVSTGGTGTGGGGVSFLNLDRTSNTLFVANFEDGFTAAVPIGADGGLGAPASIAQDTGSGPNPRQTGPHPHDVELDPTGRYALIPDFGADRVFGYRFDPATRALTAGRTAYATAPGSGPRRLAFHPDGTTAYLLSELTADVRTLRWSGDGRLAHRQTLGLSSPDFTGTPSASELAVSRDGRFVYAGNRGENSLVVLAVDPRTRLLEIVQRVDCGGTTPWGFALHPSGRWLLVANEASGSVHVFAVDRRSGALTDTGTAVQVPNPDSVTFYHA